MHAEDALQLYPVIFNPLRVLLGHDFIMIAQICAMILWFKVKLENTRVAQFKYK